ncbi:MAG: hypothetical protein Q8P07_02965 [bacterium]|nr:hypothetical protein [bacterium]
MENATAVSMEQIQQMLVGSQKLNQMKREIDATLRMALGFLTKAEVSRFCYSEVICEFATSGLNWKITKWKRECVGIDAHDAGDPRAWFAYTSTWGSDRMEMKYIQLVYQALPNVLTNLVRVFPSLAGRFAPLLQVVSK